MLAAVRADDVNLPLFLHVLGAMVMVGALVTAAYFLMAARRDGSIDSLRTGYKALLYAALPAYLAMRVGAEWIYAKENLDELPSDPGWIGIGYGVSDVGLLLLVVSTVVAGLAVRRARQAEGGEATAGSSPAIAGWLTSLLVVAYVVAVWAMTTKPS
jgi:uncharacterized membrane protein